MMMIIKMRMMNMLVFVLLLVLMLSSMGDTDETTENTESTELSTLLSTSTITTEQYNYTTSETEPHTYTTSKTEYHNYTSSTTENHNYTTSSVSVSTTKTRRQIMMIMIGVICTVFIIVALVLGIYFYVMCSENETSNKHTTRVSSGAGRGFTVLSSKKGNEEDTFNVMKPKQMRARYGKYMAHHNNTGIIIQYHRLLQLSSSATVSKRSHELNSRGGETLPHICLGSDSGTIPSTNEHMKLKLMNSLHNIPSSSTSASSSSTLAMVAGPFVSSNVSSSDMCQSLLQPTVKGLGKEVGSGRGIGKEVGSGVGGGKEVSSGRGVGKEVGSGVGGGKEVSSGRGVGKEVSTGRGVGKEVGSGVGGGKEVSSGRGAGKEVSTGRGVGKEIGSGVGVGSVGKEVGSGHGVGGAGKEFGSGSEFKTGVVTSEVANAVSSGGGGGNDGGVVGTQALIQEKEQPQGQPQTIGSGTGDNEKMLSNKSNIS